jgi:predicted acyltransferase
MNPPPSTTAADRVVSIDALRGFDMFWIMGGKPLILALAAAMIHAKEPPEWMKRQLEHTHWVGFTCYDLIMPLFMYIVGIAMPFSFAKHLAISAPHRAIYRRMASHFALLWVFGYAHHVAHALVPVSQQAVLA